VVLDCQLGGIGVGAGVAGVEVGEVAGDVAAYGFGRKFKTVLRAGMAGGGVVFEGGGDVEIFPFQAGVGGA